MAFRRRLTGLILLFEAYQLLITVLSGSLLGHLVQGRRVFYLKAAIAFSAFTLPAQDVHLTMLGLKTSRLFSPNYKDLLALRKSYLSLQPASLKTPNQEM